MVDQSWDDDTEYHRAERRAWFMVAVAFCCAVAVIGLVALTVLAGGFFVFLANALSK